MSDTKFLYGIAIGIVVGVTSTAPFILKSKKDNNTFDKCLEVLSTNYSSDENYKKYKFCTKVGYNKWKEYNIESTFTEYRPLYEYDYEYKR